MNQTFIKFYRGAASQVAQAPVGAIWFDTDDDVIKVRIATGTESDWEVYGTSPADLSALAARVQTLEDVTIPDLETTLKGLITAEADRATDAEEALADRLDIVEGEATVEGSIKKAVADAKTELIGDAETLKTFGAVEDAIADVETAAKATATLLTIDSEGHVTVSGNQNETTGAWTYTIGENDIASKAVVDTLVGDDKDMSARAIVQDEVAKQLTSENISESFDTLKEMAEWLSSHPEDVQDMIDSIGANTTAILAEILRATTTEGNLQTAIDNEVSAREAAIAALDATVGSQTVAEGKHVAVEVVETDGKLTGLTITEKDIASDARLAEIELVTSAALNDHHAQLVDHETRITTLEGAVEDLEGAIADKNVDAEGDNLVSASAANNKVTVAATQDLKDAVDAANRAVRTIASALETIQVTRAENAVNLELVWQSF